MSPTDYLPPREATDNAQTSASSGGGRKVLLWLVLIFGFVALYNGFAPAPRPGPRPPRPVASLCPEPGPLARALSWGWPAALIGGFLWLIRGQTRGAQKFNERIEPALLALADGDNRRAVDLLRGVLDHYRSQSAYAAAVRVSLGTALLRAGEDEVALEALVQAERGAGLLYGSEVRATAAAQLARLFALRGETELASRWLTDGRRRLTRAGANGRTHVAAWLALAEVLLRCRLGELELARRLLGASLRQIEGALNVPETRLAWLVAAFLEQQLATPREAGNAERYLALVRGARPGELAYAGQHWPELAAFARASQLEAALPR